MNIQADVQCENCGQDFADHDYVKDSIDKYLCPQPHTEPCYGFFAGGDPREFHLDVTDCSEKQRANHRKACELWDEAEARGETPEPEKCPSGFEYDENGRCVGHVLRAPYGIGTYISPQ